MLAGWRRGRVSRGGGEGAGETGRGPSVSRRFRSGDLRRGSLPLGDRPTRTLPLPSPPPLVSGHSASTRSLDPPHSPVWQTPAAPPEGGSDPRS
ncbi:hypothetical protein GBAR_LOCUS25735 [Geodia barretti]|uniref:Uncharacterized protein n=1 Tax=Geodia barretti TaxID=519541 RepID=A0AA35XCK9_GEOBA|nr:hypothetical protein GBAR_LOCUS25735 [Geodia barretti]